MGQNNNCETNGLPWKGDASYIIKIVQIKWTCLLTYVKRQSISDTKLPFISCTLMNVSWGVVRLGYINTAYMIMANGLYDELTFLQGMLSWWVCWASVHSPAAAPARVQGRVFYHHWRSPNRWSQKTTARDSDISTFSFLHTPALHTVFDP